jgi:hypothetical protein
VVNLLPELPDLRQLLDRLVPNCVIISVFGVVEVLVLIIRRVVGAVAVEVRVYIGLGRELVGSGQVGHGLGREH